VARLTSEKRGGKKQGTLPGCGERERTGVCDAAPVWRERGGKQRIKRMEKNYVYVTVVESRRTNGN